MEWDRQGKITVNRNDSVKIDSRAWVDLKENQTLYFGVYEFGKEFCDSFISKSATVDNPVIEFSEEDTKYGVGKYRYQVKVRAKSGCIKTVQGETVFEVRR